VIAKICLFCGKSFIANHKGRKYCTHDCYIEQNKLLTKDERKKFGSKGKKHPRYGKKWDQKTINKITQSCKLASNMWISKLTDSEKKKKFGQPGEKNPMYNTEPPVGSGRCRWYKYKGENLQGSYELRFAKMCDKNNIKWKKVHKSIPYTKNNVKRTYLPDFEAWFDKRNPVFIDTKGYFDECSQIKIRLVREQHKDKRFIIVDKKLLRQYEQIC